MIVIEDLKHEIIEKIVHTYNKCGDVPVRHNYVSVAEDYLTQRKQPCWDEG